MLSSTFNSVQGSGAATPSAEAAYLQMQMQMQQQQQQHPQNASLSTFSGGSSALGGALNAPPYPLFRPGSAASIVSHQHTRLSTPFIPSGGVTPGPPAGAPGFMYGSAPAHAHVHGGSMNAAVGHMQAPPLHGSQQAPTALIHLADDLARARIVVPPLSAASLGRGPEDGSMPAYRPTRVGGGVSSHSSNNVNNGVEPMSAELGRERLRVAQARIRELERELEELQVVRLRETHAKEAYAALESKLAATQQRLSALLLQQQLRGLTDVDWTSPEAYGIRREDLRSNEAVLPNDLLRIHEQQRRNIASKALSSSVGDRQQQQQQQQQQQLHSSSAAAAGHAVSHKLQRALTASSSGLGAAKLWPGGGLQTLNASSSLRGSLMLRKRAYDSTNSPATTALVTTQDQQQQQQPQQQQQQQQVGPDLAKNPIFAPSRGNDSGHAGESGSSGRGEGHHVGWVGAPGGVGAEYNPNALALLHTAELIRTSQHHKGKVSSMTQEVDASRDAVRLLEKKVDDAENERAALLAVQARLEKELEAAVTRADRAQEDLIASQNELYSLRETVEDSTKELLLMRNEHDTLTLQSAKSDALASEVAMLRTETAERGAKITDLDKNVSELRRSLAERTERATQLETELVSTKSQLSKSELLVNELRERCAPVGELRTTNKHLVNKTRELEWALSQRTEKVAELDMKIAEREATILELERKLDEVTADHLRQLEENATRLALSRRARKAVPLLVPVIGLELATSKTKDGVVVRKVVDGEPAQLAGVHQGDKVLSAMGKAVHTKGELLAILAPLKPDTTVQLEVLRRGAVKPLELTIGAKGYTRDQLKLLLRVAAIHEQDFVAIKGTFALLCFVYFLIVSPPIAVD